jgi:cathepsin L
MKTIILLALFACALAYTEVEYQSAFTFWMQEYGRSYTHEEFQHRYRIFRHNIDFIAAHNNGNKGFTVALNEFADLSLQEFQRIYLGTKVTVPHAHVAPMRNLRLPVSFDWRSAGAVTAIKNQGQCGSCWSFSTTGSVEACHFFAAKNLVGLSEQNLMDCSTSQGNQGCEGGLMTQAMDYIISNKGVDTEASYPYTAADGTCAFNPSNVGATLKSYTNVKTGSEQDLQTKVALGPTSVAIDASHSSFQFYSSGVYNEPDCSTSQLDHGVLAIGWGVDSGSDFWLVKNSWGTSWGLKGYIEMTRDTTGNTNQCGIATMATLPSC